MAFVAAKCTSCGGTLQVDNSKKAAICPYCGSAYVVQDAVNNYMMSVQNLHADVVNVHDDRATKARLEAGEAFLKLKQWEKADGAFKDACDLTPQNYLGWWGRIRALTEEFTIRYTNDVNAMKSSYRLHEEKLQELEDLFASVSTFAPKDKQAELSNTFNAYADTIRTVVKKGKDWNERCNQKLQLKIDATQAKVDEARKNYDAYKNKKRYKDDKLISIYESGVGRFFATIIIAFTIFCSIGFFITSSPIPYFVVIPVLTITILLAISDGVNKGKNKKLQRKEEEYMNLLRDRGQQSSILSLAQKLLNQPAVPSRPRFDYHEGKQFDEALSLLREIIDSTK